MKFSNLLFIVPGISGANLGKTGGIQPVIKLLQDMLQEVQEDVATSRSEFDKVEEQCAKVHTQESQNIEMLSQQLVFQKAAKEEGVAQLTKAGDAIEAANSKLQKTTDKLKAAEKLFADEKAEFIKLDEESATTISMVGRAIRALQRTEAKAEEAKTEPEIASQPAFLQQSEKSEKEKKELRKQKSLEAVSQAMDALVRADISTLNHKEKVMALISFGQPQALEPAAYESKMGGVIEMFEKFMAEEEATKNARAQDWSEKKMKLQLNIQQLQNNIQTFNATIVREKQKKASAEEAAAKAEGKIVSLTGEIKESQATLNDNRIECKTAKEDFDRIQQDFAAQVKALGEAQKILQQAPDLIQVEPRESGSQNQDENVVPSFVQTRMTSELASESMEIQTRRTKASIYLSKLGGAVFQQIAVRVSEAPFEKVMGMIRTMIEKLEKEAADAADKKAYCDQAKKESKTDLQKKNQEEGKISARLEQARADKGGLEKKISQLTKHLESINADVKSLTDIRTEEKTQNDAEIVRSQANAEACSKAITVLQEYFSSGAPAGSEEAPTEEEEAPAAFVQTGMHTRTKNANAIIYLLQEAEADFARTNADTKAIEAELAAAYEKAMQDFRVEKATTEETIKGNQAEIARLNKVISDTGIDIDNAVKEMDDAKVVAAKIKEECEVKVPSHEERQKRRQKEIDGLKMGLDILKGEAE